MGVSYGVAEVRIKGEKPYLTETGSIQFPELGFDTPEYERDFPGREGTIDVINGSIWNLNDVKASFIRNEMHGFLGKVDWNATLAPGQYAVNIAESKVRLSDTTSYGANTEDFLNTVMTNAGFFLEATGTSRPTGSVADKPTDVSLELDGYVLTFANRSFPIFAANESGGQLLLTLCFDRDDVNNGDSLLWNNAEQKFIPGRAGKGIYVEIEGDTMKGDLNMDGNDLNGLTTPPATDSSAASKEWVLSLLDGMVQPGMIMFWASTRPVPSGWLKMDGSPFSMADNPKMHDVLLGFGAGYSNGRTPDWGGRFLFQTNGTSNNQQENGGIAGQYASQRTANAAGNGVKVKEDEGKHKHQWVRQNGKGAGTSSGSHVIRDKTSGAGNSKATYYTDTGVTHEGQHKHNLEGWDSVTRPNSVCGYWIIKMDYYQG